MAIDHSNLDSMIGGFSRILSISTIGANPPIPTPIIITGVPRRSGLSAIKIARNIISRKSEAGIPVGALPSGAANPEEIMWRIAVEEIIKAFQEDAIITVGIPPGTTLSAAGASLAGPVTVFGSTITFTKGFGVIQ
ncbi:MAG: hypothetical protein ACOC22_02060 [bacterium]